ncbi:uncharacterized protein L201_006727 [Kwoniella dendrophila CBS 6074]|uniref:BRCT domain-containing protein n=1 Tax=Kwoniella dendrophila CBS 6074 TaxID=1295534 RepID=A0AAX4K2D9_9TREE
MSSPSSTGGPSSQHALQKGNHPKHLGKNKMEKFTFTLGKLDAGMAILLGPNAHLLEFPSLLLPTPSPGTPPLGPGSILTITVSRDIEAEFKSLNDFKFLQSNIIESFSKKPLKPILKLRNVTQTSVCVEWEKINLGSSNFRSLEMFRNGQRWGRVGDTTKNQNQNQNQKNEWKTGGLQSGEEYTFQLVLKTTAGTYPSNLIRVRTHTMDNLTGLLIHFGPIHPPQLLSQLRESLQQIGARESPTVALDTTHFVCTTPIVGGDDSGRGGQIDPEYQEATRMNLPVVGPGWLMAVAGERKLVPISNYLLPSLPQATTTTSDPAPFRRPSPQKRSSLPFTSSSPTSPHHHERPEEIRRSPSPETIARMSMHASSTKPNMLRNNSMEGRRSREMSLDVDVDRPRSPKPEADGKLDRGFKFPLSGSVSNSPSQSPTERDTRRSASPSRRQTAPAVPSIQEIPKESEQPASAPISGRDVPIQPSVQAAVDPTTSGPVVDAIPEHASTAAGTSEGQPIDAISTKTTQETAESRISEERTPTEETKEESAIIEEPAEIAQPSSNSGPPPVITEEPASPTTAKTQASTIDEAIANFENAIAKTPEPVEEVSAPASEVAPETEKVESPIIKASEEPRLERVEDKAVPATALPITLPSTSKEEKEETQKERSEAVTPEPASGSKEESSAATTSKNRKKKNKKKKASNASGATPLSSNPGTGSNTPALVEEGDEGGMDEIDLS